MYNQNKLIKCIWGAHPKNILRALISLSPQASSWRIRTPYYLTFLLNPPLPDRKVQTCAIKCCILFACDLHAIYSEILHVCYFYLQLWHFPLNFFSNWNKVLLMSGWAGGLKILTTTAILPILLSPSSGPVSKDPGAHILPMKPLGCPPASPNTQRPALSSQQTAPLLEHPSNQGDERAEPRLSPQLKHDPLGFWCLSR